MNGIESKIYKTKRQRSPRLRRAPLLLLLVFLFSSLACNLPIFVTPAPIPDTSDAVRQTLEARLFATPLATPTQAAVTGAATPEPPPGAPTPELPVMTLFPATTLPELRVVTPGVPASTLENGVFRYITQPGDTVAALALRFGVEPEQILDPALFPSQIYLPVGLLLSIPDTLGSPEHAQALMPDGEVVYSSAARDFSVEEYVRAAGGYLSTYTEQVEARKLTGAQIIQRVADETSINPRMLLAFLELRSGWVRGFPDSAGAVYPIGFYANEYSGLYKEITLVARQLTIAYYGWRSGKVLEVFHPNRTLTRFNPTINAGTAAVQYLFAVLYDPADWQAQLYGDARFTALYLEMFGDPWQRASALGALLPDNLAQPLLELPFNGGERWSFTGGPHAAWGVGSALGGIDFAPVIAQVGCGVSTGWATAAAPGLVLRSDNAQVTIDLDGDGSEQTGWVLLYLHVAAKDRVAPGTFVNTNDRIGHPSCEGGVSTGTHVHIARKYNGEWIAADGPVPFVLSGWQVKAGDRVYKGTLVRGEQVVSAQPDGSHTSIIVR